MWLQKFSARKNFGSSKIGDKKKFDLKNLWGKKIGLVFSRQPSETLHTLPRQPRSEQDSLFDLSNDSTWKVKKELNEASYQLAGS